MSLHVVPAPSHAQAKQRRCRRRPSTSRHRSHHSTSTQIRSVSNSANALTRHLGAIAKPQNAHATVPPTTRHRFQYTEIGSPIACFVSLSPLSIVLRGNTAPQTLTTRDPLRQAFSLPAAAAVQPARNRHGPSAYRRAYSQESFLVGARLVSCGSSKCVSPHPLIAPTPFTLHRPPSTVHCPLQSKQRPPFPQLRQPAEPE